MTTMTSTAAAAAPAPDASVPGGGGDPLPLRASAEIQGDVLAGFKKDHATMLFLRFSETQAARAWLGRLAPMIATTRQVAAFNAEFSAARRQSAGDDPRTFKATWLGLSMTYEGLRFFAGPRHEVFPKIPVGTTIEAFAQGPFQRALALGDTDDSDPRHWLFGNSEERAIHAVLTIASDRADDLGTAVTEQREAVSRAGGLIVFEQEAATLTGGRRGKEHFGFKDGVSEPGVRGFDPEDPLRKGYVQGHPGTRLIDAGEFVIGHEPSPAHSPDTYARDAMPAWMDNGSFAVIRRLDQDVPGWWAQVGVALRQLVERKVVPEGTGSEWLAARMVGRWRSGASVAKCPMKPTNTTDAEPDNDFDFLGDSEGFTTPLFSHLRKNNPRAGLIDGGEPVEERFMDARRIMRRGSPYGQPFDPTSDDEAYAPDASRGLLFVCYQADLVGQFEFIQADWVNDPDFPHGRQNRPGPDAMTSGKLSDTNDGKVSFESHSPSGEQQTTTLTLSQFVRTRGAVYTFAPSISTLKSLAKGSLGGEQPKAQALDAVVPIPGEQDRYWVFQDDTVREAAAWDGGSSLPLSAWPALKGVTRVDAVLPVPDVQGVGGKSAYWIFHTVDGRQVYRYVTVSDTPPHTSGTPGPDRPLSNWNSLPRVTHADAFLPIPDMQPYQGRHYYWAFHTTAEGQRYRIISIAVTDGGQHGDVLERDDRGMDTWPSLEGVGHVDAVLPVPGRQHDNGRSLSWVFHQERFRVIAIAERPDHADTMVGEDRPATQWPDRP